MYDYYDELNKIYTVIDAYVTRVKAGIINIPAEELSGEQTAIEWVAYMLHHAIDDSVRQ